MSRRVGFPCAIVVVTFLFQLVASMSAGNGLLRSGPYELAANNFTTSSCSYDTTCMSGGYEGVCVSVSAGCCSSGTTTSGLCPGSSDIQCCTQSKCSTPSGSGTCMQSSLCSSKGGTSVAGFCTGPSDLQCCVSNPTPPAGVYGVDVCDTITPTAASCFKSAGINYVIPRGYRSTGVVDTQVCTSMINAQNAGIATRDTYMFPCPTCSRSAAGQLSDLVSYLNTNCKSVWSGRVWLDIEGTQYWLGSYTKNQDWYKQLKDACATYGIRCGVYSSSVQWSAIFGSTSFVYGSELPLWYAHYDNNPSFSDFSAFGGWAAPSVKQYAGDTTQCSMDVDKNYAPSF